MVSSLLQTSVVDWLLQGDPAIRWQVIRDLLDGPAAEVAEERARVGTEGWGRQLLARQDPSGTWGNGLYSPKWTSTTYTLLLLRRLGLPPDNAAARRGAQCLFDKGEWLDGGVIFWKRRIIDVAVLGLVLSIAAYFRLAAPRLAEMVGYLNRHQAADGGWDDEVKDVAHKPFHITIAVLEGLHEYQQTLPAPDATVSAMLGAGQNFLLRHQIYLSAKTAGPLDAAWTRFSFPPRWRYDVLRALDHFQAGRVPYDKRLQHALDLVKKKRRVDGTWILQNRHAGRTYFELESVGKPSRWNTLRAMRVLRFYQANI